jgi:hypothetical protein
MRALANKLNWIPSLFEPFVSNRMIEQHAHEIANFALLEFPMTSPSLRRNCLNQDSTAIVRTSRMFIEPQRGRTHRFRNTR